MRTLGRFLTLLAAGLAAPSLAAQQAPSLIDAATALKTQLGQVAPTSDPPMLSNAGAPLVRAAFDLQAIRAMPLDLSSVAGTCGAVGGALLAYGDFVKRATAGAGDAAAEALYGRLHDETVLGTAAGNLCAGRTFAAAVPVVTGIPTGQRAGAAAAVKQMHDGAAQTINGTLDMVEAPAITTANRTMLLSSLLESGAGLVPSLPTGERQLLRQHILDVHDRAAPADRAQLAMLAQLYLATDCNALCEIGNGN